MQSYKRFLSTLEQAASDYLERQLHVSTRVSVHTKNVYLLMQHFELTLKMYNFTYKLLTLIKYTPKENKHIFCGSGAFSTRKLTLVKIVKKKNNI